MRLIPRLLFVALVGLPPLGALHADTETPSVRVLVVAARDRYHTPMVDAAEPLLASLAKENGFALDLTRDPSVITDEGLARYDVVVQLHLAPFDLSKDQQDALQRFVTRGKGWVGIHAAGLTGRQFLDPNGGAPYWQWFEDFLGGVVYSPHPALQKGTVVVEDRTHPITRNLPSRFELLDEWYEFDKSPRANVHVLATADESTYTPNKPMGDHPLVWTNPKSDRAVYIGVGHDASACEDARFKTLLRDSILWAGRPEKPPRFRALVLAERDSTHHKAFVEAAKPWLSDLARREGFAVDFIEKTDTIDEAMLARYRLFVQLDYPPYAWKPAAMRAFTKYIEKGRGGWVGFHHATLLGEFDGFPMWTWFSTFMGKIRFQSYIPTFASGTVHVEDAKHPVLAGVPATFVIDKEEWYTYDRSPRGHVRVLATVDEGSYVPDSKIKMGGDHPVVWTNDRVKARNVYIFMGHGPDLLQNDAWTKMARNALLWAASR